MLNKLNHGQQMALTILTAKELNLEPALVDHAESVMKGAKLHPIVHKQIEDEAIRLHNKISDDAELVKKANTKAEEIAIRFH